MRERNPSILLELKAGTADLHERIEAAPLLAKLGEADDENYGALLLRFWGFYRPLETRLAVQNWRAVGLEFDERKKCGLLEKDLDGLGIGESARRAAPLCQALPECEGLARAFGCLYVLEGSTLGGQFLKKRATERGPRPVVFFNGYGPDTARMWKGFQQVLGGYVARQQESQTVIEAARSTFARLHQWLESGC